MILFFCLLFLIGCVGNLSNLFLLTVPDDGGMDEYDPNFISLIKNLNTPEKLSSWLKNNTTFKNNFGSLTPYEFYLKREGDCNDYKIFNCYVLHYNGYNVNQLNVKFNNLTGHGLAIFENKGNKPYKYGIVNVKSSVTNGKILGKQFNYNTISGVIESLEYWYERKIIIYSIDSWNNFIYKNN